MASLIHNIRHDARAIIEWHAIFVDALKDRDDLGMFPSEFRNWFIDQGHDYDGKVCAVVGRGETARQLANGDGQKVEGVVIELGFALDLAGVYLGSVRT